MKVESRSTTPPASRRKVEWQYDALGRRIGQTTSDRSSGTWQVTEDLKFVSDPVLFGRHIAELNATNNALVHSYVWGLDLSGSLDGAGGVAGLLFVTQHSTPQPSTHFVTYDGNGNVVRLVSATTGTETARYEYGPFGEPIRVTGAMAKENPFRFSTKRTDNTTDLVLYEYRPYSPTLRRWLSRDPVEERGGLNLHGFLGNDSMNLIDALGLETYQEVMAQIKDLDDSVKRIKCCCTTHPSYVKVGLSGVASGASITHTVDVKKFGCVKKIWGFYWWVCATAQDDAPLWAFPPYSTNDKWQEWGYRKGAQTRTQRHVGSPTSGRTDNSRWNFHVIVVIVICGRDGRLHADWYPTNQWLWTWDENTKSWTNPHIPDTHEMDR